jgi:hypothetical protein
MLYSSGYRKKTWGTCEEAPRFIFTESINLKQKKRRVSIDSTQYKKCCNGGDEVKRLSAITSNIKNDSNNENLNETQRKTKTIAFSALMKAVI